MASVVIALKKGRDRAKFLADLRAAGFKPRPIDGLRRHIILDGAALASLPAQLRNDPAIEAIDDGDKPIAPADQALSLDATLTDDSWALARIIRRSAPWNVDRIRLPFDTYFRCARDGSGVDHYHFDTGIRATHDEFGGRVTNVYEYFSSGGAGDDHGHGTITASCFGGSTCGVARGSDIFGFKIAGSDGFTSSAAMLACIGQALTHYAGRSAPATANISFTPTFDANVNSAIGDMIDDGIVVTMSAGNAGDSLASGYLSANVADLLLVGAFGMADIPMWFAAGDGSMRKTNYGSAVDIMAPGQMLRAAFRDSDSTYAQTTGATSAASAFVAGVVACMLQGHSRLTGRTQVQAVITKLLANATTGKLRDAFGLSPLPDKLLYLDPDQTAPETISGL